MSKIGAKTRETLLPLKVFGGLYDLCCILGQIFMAASLVGWANLMPSKDVFNNEHIHMM